MDFESIESLNEEELNSLYEEFNSDMDDVHVVNCDCWTAEGMATGHGQAGYEVDLHRGYGTCDLLVEHGLYSYSECVRWCRSLGFRMKAFYINCFCPRYGQDCHGAYGWLSRCTWD